MPEPWVIIESLQLYQDRALNSTAAENAWKNSNPIYKTRLKRWNLTQLTAASVDIATESESQGKAYNQEQV